MNNPFEYGIAVTGASFCNRTKETADLVNTINNSKRAFLYSERMMGKTSLLLRVLKNLDREKYIGAYIDLWPTDDEASFITATAKGISQAMGTTAGDVIAASKKFFSRLAPKVSLGDDGLPKISFEYNPTVEQAKKSLEEVLAVPQHIASETGKRVAIVFDELQRILEYDDDHVERLLRSIIQRQNNVAYIFLGSQKHLISDMFLNRKRPLYSAADHFPIGPIEVKHWRPFIREKFEASDRKIGTQVIEQICELTQGHPFYTQHLCHAIWERCEPGKEVTRDDIRKGVQVVLAREASAYTALWESLTINQRRFLRGLAVEDHHVSPYSSAFLQKYGLGHPSSIQRLSSALIKRDVIDRDARSYLISDRFLRIWIREREE
ncbi:MAG TPA: ATP-binding protein [Edaphobacter sp.]|jgi:hypothetical protein|nr:ATP-binding protein [Edaphobacter sp.]